MITNFTSEGKNYSDGSRRNIGSSPLAGIKWGCFSIFLFVAAVALAYAIISQLPF